MTFAVVAPGDRAPGFTAASPSNPQFRFDSVAGRWLVLFFAGSLRDPAGAAALRAVEAAEDVFDDARAALFTVTLDPEDEAAGRLVQKLPGRRLFRDFDGAVSRLYGSVREDARPGSGALEVRRFWVVIDPGLTVRAVIPFAAGGADVAELLALLRAAPPAGRHLGLPVPPPVLVLPQVLEPELCDRMTALYEAQGGRESGFMRDRDGKTVQVLDPAFKQRRDVEIPTDDPLRAQIQARILRRIVPEIERVHFFKVTRMERWIVSCYDSAEGGHFAPHRDNTTMGTAHRRYAVSINLNDDFDGGEVSFPEYAPQGFKAPTGGAVIFSCSLLHAVSQVTRGRRFAFLPFLYDDAAAAIRERNAAAVAGGAYRA